MRKGCFTGTFDPFTVGHLDVVKRALALFDELTICVCFNEKKTFECTTQERVANIRRIFQDEPRVKVDSWDKLTVDYCAEHDIHYIIKGVRNAADFEYEKEQADINRELSGVETILFLADPKLSKVSSSMVKLLKSYGRDVTKYIA